MKIKNLGFLGFPLYEITDSGIVYSLKYRGKDKRQAMKQYKDTKGYYQVGLRNEFGRKMMIVHRLVAICFLENPNNYPQVNHKDENKTNNCVENLEWCSNIYNSNYGTRNERMSKTLKGIEKPHFQKPVEQLDKDWKHIAFYKSMAEAKRQTGAENISNVCCGKTKNGMSANFRWRFIF